MKLIRFFSLALSLLAFPMAAQAARTVLNPITATHSGVLLSFTASDQTNGNSFRPDPHTALIVQNTTAGAITLTIHTNAFMDGDTASGLRVPDRVITVPANSVGTAGPFTGSLYRQNDGFVWIDSSAALNYMVLQIIVGAD
jgi:hypothetical protein